MLAGVSASVVSPGLPTVNSSAGRRVVTAVPVKDRAASGQLTDAQKSQVDKLRKIDREVKAHEQAHKNAGGQYAGSASFSYVVGPDGKRYAVAGEVPIDISPVKNNPAATVAKMIIVAAAALAPAQPSGQDQRVAAQANALEIKAQSELARKSRAKLRRRSGNIPPTGTSQAEKSGNFVAGTLAALAAYNARASTANNGGIPGNILNIIG